MRVSDDSISCLVVGDVISVNYGYGEIIVVMVDVDGKLHGHIVYSDDSFLTSQVWDMPEYVPWKYYLETK